MKSTSKKPAKKLTLTEQADRAVKFARKKIDLALVTVLPMDESMSLLTQAIDALQPVRTMRSKAKVIRPLYIEATTNWLAMRGRR
jgi:hypothetical protein